MLPVCSNSREQSGTHQFEDQFFLIKMSELMSWPPLRPARTGVQGCASWNDRATSARVGRGAIPSRRHGQKGWSSVDRIHDGLQETPSLELVRWDLADRRRGPRSGPRWWGCTSRKWTGSGCRVGLVAGRGEVGNWRADAAAGVGRCWCCMGDQPRVHHLPRRLPASKKRQLND